MVILVLVELVVILEQNFVLEEPVDLKLVMNIVQLVLNLAENLVLVVIFEPVVLLVILDQNLVLEEQVDLKLVLNIVLVVLDLVSKELLPQQKLLQHLLLVN